MLGEEEIPHVHCWSRVRKWSMETFFCHKTCGGGGKLEGKVVEVAVGYVVTPEPLLFVSKNKPRPFSYQNITFKKKNTLSYDTSQTLFTVYRFHTRCVFLLQKNPFPSIPSIQYIYTS